MKPTFVVEDETFFDVKVLAGEVVWLLQSSHEGKQAQINLSANGARDLAKKLLETLPG